MRSVGRRRKRKAKATPEAKGFLVHFIPGGYYHLWDGALYTGVHRRPASAKIGASLIDLALKAAVTPGQWVEK